MSYIVTDINNSGNDLNKIKQLISDLNTEQQKLVISASNLSVVEKTKLGILSGTENVIKANTVAIQSQTLSEEEWLTQQWLSIGAEEADTVATGANTVAKKANLSVTNLLKVATSKLTTAIAANPVVAITAVTLGALLLIKKYYDHVEKVRQQLKETAKEAKSAIDEINSSFKTLSSTTNDIKKRYAELAQGVENLGKVNQSRGSLSNDDYEEFLDLSNQLAKLFPQLTVGYDDNGNAILNLSGNVNTIVGSLNNLVDVQQKLANQEILSKMSDVWAGYIVELEDYNKELKASQDSINQFLKLIKEIPESQTIGISVADYSNFLNKAVHKAGINDSVLQNALRQNYGKARGYSYLESYTLDLQKLTEAEKDALLNALGELSSEYNKAVQMAKGNIASANADMSNYINTWLSGEWNYSKMDSNLQNVVKDVLLNTDWANALPSDVNSNDWDEVSNWLQRNFLYAINDIDNEEIEKALVDAFNDNLSIESLKKIINQLDSGNFGFTEDNPLIIYLQAKLTEKEDIRDSLRNSLNQISTYDSIYTDYEELSYLEEYTKDFTQAQADLWLQVTQGAENAVDAVNRYEEALKNANETDPAIFSDIFTLKDAENNLNTLGELNDQLDKIQAAYKNLSDAMDTYAETGYITIDQFQAIVEQGSQFLDYLELEDGQLDLNEQAMYDLAEARIVEMKAQMLQGIVDNVSKIESETDAANYLTTTNYELAESYHELAEAKIRDWAANSALSQESKDAVVNKALGDIDKIKALVAKIDLSSIGSKASKSFTDTLDKELSALDKKMEAGYIDFNDYIQARLDLIEDYYRQGKISADEYYSYLEKHYKQELSYMDKVVNAVKRKIDRELDSLEKRKSNIENYYNSQIEYLESEKELLVESNAERERQLNLSKSLFEIERARNQRNKLVYKEGVGMVYETDPDAIRSAEEDADRAKYEIQISEIEKSISKLEEARDKETDAIDEMISKLQDYKDSWQDITSAYAEAQEDLIAEQILGAEWENDILNGRLDVLNSFKDQYIAIQQAMVDAAHQAAQAIANEQNTTISDSSGGKKIPLVDDSNNPYTSTSGGGGGSVGLHELGSNIRRNMEQTHFYGSGTDNAQKGLNLVGEDGAEAYFDNDGHVAIVTEPTLIPMEGGEVVKNEQDTKKLLDPDNIQSDVKYTTLENGVKLFEDGTIIRPNGDVLPPMPADDPFMQMYMKFHDNIKDTGALIRTTAVQKNMEEMNRAIETINNVNNSRTQSVNIGDINITCPGITSREVAKQVGVEVNNLFNGLHLDAMQESKKR